MRCLPALLLCVLALACDGADQLDGAFVADGDVILGRGQAIQCNGTLGQGGPGVSLNLTVDDVFLDVRNETRLQGRIQIGAVQASARHVLVAQGAKLSFAVQTGDLGMFIQMDSSGAGSAWSTESGPDLHPIRCTVGAK